MIKLRSITFKNHPILGNLHLDFTVNGKVVDTIIFAGENGVGKSRILKTIFALTDHNLLNKSYISELELENNSAYEKIDISINSKGYTYFNNGKNNLFVLSDEFKLQYPFKVIYSDVGINYNVPKISTITSLDIDEDFRTLKSSDDTARMITQLLIDIDVLDAIEYRNQYEIAKKCGNDLNEFKPSQRMDRFKSAFEQMFTHIKWQGVENVEGRKKVCFQVYDEEVELNDLSSGEKQIIFRGGLLLKNKDASRSAYVLIDEPEISLHPDWQKKIMSFYKDIFTDEQGVQFSQIFAVTHSPFIIHNENRYNDKVIVLKRNDSGEIFVDENASYYSVGDPKIIEEAFNINDFTNNAKTTVYVEGITDEKYLKSVADTFDIKLDFDIKWIGEKGKKGDEKSGCTALEQAKNILSKLPFKNMVLFDCDVTQEDTFNQKELLYIKKLRLYQNSRSIQVGIENALILDDLDISSFYTSKEIKDKMGGKQRTEKLNKVNLCDYICSLGIDERKKIFANLKNELEEIVELLSDKKQWN